MRPADSDASGIPEPLRCLGGEVPFRVLSDLHLGNDQSVVRKVSELRPLLAGGGVVIFNGDTLEQRAACYREKSAQMLGELSDLCRAEGVEPIMLNGNHDPLAWGSDALDAAGGRIFLMHGHALLRLISPWSSKVLGCLDDLEKMLAARGPMEELPLEDRLQLTRELTLRIPAAETRQGGHGLGGMAVHALREMWPPRRPWHILRTWITLPKVAAAFAARYRPGCDFMIFGHTHRSGCWQRHGRWLINTGGFVSFSQPLTVAWDGSRLAVTTIRRSGNEFVTDGTRILPDTSRFRQVRLPPRA
jgi:predicted phosphodiesterase